MSILIPWFGLQRFVATLKTANKKLIWNQPETMVQKSSACSLVLPPVQSHIYKKNGIYGSAIGESHTSMPKSQNGKLRALKRREHFSKTMMRIYKKFMEHMLFANMWHNSRIHFPWARSWPSLPSDAWRILYCQEDFLKVGLKGWKWGVLPPPTSTRQVEKWLKDILTSLTMSQLQWKICKHTSRGPTCDVLNFDMCAKNPIFGQNKYTLMVWQTLTSL